MKNLTILLFAFCIIYTSCSDAHSSSTEPTKESIVLMPAAVVAPNVSPKTYNKTTLPYLERAATLLANDEILYNWTDYTSCNVGVIAQLCSNTTIRELKNKVNNEYAEYITYANKQAEKGNWTYVMSWKQMNAYYCGVTDKPIDGILSDLKSKGFSGSDIGHLEFLSDKYILSQTDIDTSNPSFYAYKDNLVKYLKAWIGIIKRQ